MHLEDENDPLREVKEKYENQDLATGLVFLLVGRADLGYKENVHFSAVIVQHFSTFFPKSTKKAICSMI